MFWCTHPDKAAIIATCYYVNVRMYVCTYVQGGGGDAFSVCVCVRASFDVRIASSFEIRTISGFTSFDVRIASSIEIRTISGFTSFDTKPGSRPRLR